MLNHKGVLYIVATPIGNLQDISSRAKEILQYVDVIACEDTRRTGILLQAIKGRYSEKKPLLLSYYEQNELQRIPEVVSYLQKGGSVALVSDAGTPTISDPGFKLVRECIQQGIKVESIPGPSSVIVALTVSGLPTDRFLFLGYLPKKPGHRLQLLQNLKTSLGLFSSTVIIFEAPHKLIKTLEHLLNVFSDIDIVLCRELTKIHEEVRREKVSQSLAHFQKTNPKGEFVVLFHI